MSEVLIKNLQGADQPVEKSAVGDLRSELDGALVLPNDQGFDALREVWNGQIDRRPGMIIRAGSTADVVTAVNFVRENELLCSVRGGGHNAAGLAVSDGGVMIDLHSLSRTRVDPERRRSYAQGGATWFDYDRECQSFGLASPGGAVSHTGIAGLTLGGGVGWLSGKYGLACDAVASFEVVTADGELRRVSADADPDLNWALRGGGGNFGIVTQFEYELQPLDKMYGGLIIYPFDTGRDFLRMYADYLHESPDEFGAFVGYMNLPDGTPAFGGVLSWVGPPEEGEAELQRFRDVGNAFVDTLGPVRYTEIQRMNDEATRKHGRYYTKSNLFTELNDEIIDIMVEKFQACPSPMSMLVFQQFGNAVSRVDKEATAFGHRDVKLEQLAFAAWTDPAQDEVNRAWTRDIARTLQPFSHGAYVNQVGEAEDEVAGGIKAAYGSNWDRLLELKRRYDPANLFRHNQNISVANG